MRYIGRFLSAALFVATPAFSAAETLICSKFDHFNAQSLLDFRQVDKSIHDSGEITDWMPGTVLPSNLDKIVIALRKDIVPFLHGCVEAIEEVLPGVSRAIEDAAAGVGTPPELPNEPVNQSGVSVFGPIITSVHYLREGSLTVQIIITRDSEPSRSVEAIERYYNLPLGYCERHDSCGINTGAD